MMVLYPAHWFGLALGHLHLFALQNKSTGLERVSHDGLDPELDRLTNFEFVVYLLAAVGLVLLAGLVSGLTLGLMSLDDVDLEVLRRSGTSRQRACAEKILPVLSNPHRLLVTLLLINAAANEALPLVLDRLTDPITAVIISVTVVLIFGEIIPQAACSRFGLQIGAASTPMVRALMVVAAPLAVPIGWVLDRALGHRHTALFRRAEFKALVDIHGPEGQGLSGGSGKLSADEVQVIKGALDLTHKRARAAMTPLDMVFMLPLDAVLDEPTLTSILASGHSRIPVHRHGDRSSILGIMLVKELILVDPKAGVKVSSMKVRSLPHLLAETPMYDMLKLFELGRSHMAVLTTPTKEALAARRAAEDAVAIDLYSFEDDSIGGDYDNDDIEADDGAGGDEPLSFAKNRDGSDDGASEGLLLDVDVFSLNFAQHELAPIGIITIEDVLEELLGAEIIDETDAFVDNLHRTRVDATVLAHSLPPHLRKALATWSITPRVGPAMQVYRLSSNAGGSLLSRNATTPALFPGQHPPPVASAAPVSAAAVGAQHAPSAATTPDDASAPRSRAARGTRPPLHERLTSPERFAHLPRFRSGERLGRLGAAASRRSTHMTASVQAQLDLLKPLLGEVGRGAPRLGFDGDGEGGRGNSIDEKALRRENSC